MSRYQILERWVCPSHKQHDYEDDEQVKKAIPCATLAGQRTNNLVSIVYVHYAQLWTPNNVAVRLNKKMDFNW